MLAVTDAAANRLHELLDKAREEPSVADDAVIRLKVTDEGGLGFVLDQERPGDNSVAFEGHTVLICDGSIAQELSGQTLDVINTGQGESFSLK